MEKNNIFDADFDAEETYSMDEIIQEYIEEENSIYPYIKDDDDDED